MEKNCARGWFYLQDYTRMHGKKNIKLWMLNLVSLEVFMLEIVRGSTRSHSLENSI
jgi:hypothetical protein